MNDKEIAKKFLEEHKAFLQKWDVKYGISVIIPEIKIKRRIMSEKIIFTDDDYFSDTSENVKFGEGTAHIDVSEESLLREQTYEQYLERNDSEKTPIADIDLDSDLEREMQKIVTETTRDVPKKESGEDPVKQTESSKLKKMLGLK